MTSETTQRETVALLRRLLELVDSPGYELSDEGVKNRRVRHQVEGAMLALDVAHPALDEKIA